MKPDWVTEVEAYCRLYNIPIDYLADILYEPKVIPMIRGKAFEFSTLLLLQKLLPADEFEISKAVMNAQLAEHDIDIEVFHKPTQVKLSVECKLSGKGTYRFDKQQALHSLRVKCMRSRTLGARMIDQQARKLGIERNLLAVHNDSYLPEDFDIVLTSIANAFYVTRPDGVFDWQPSTKEKDFLRGLFGDLEGDELKAKSFQSVYLAHSYDLAILPENHNQCPRRACPQKRDCRFIPNYPFMYFTADKQVPDAPWHSLADAASLLRNVALFKKAQIS